MEDEINSDESLDECHRWIISEAYIGEGGHEIGSEQSLLRHKMTVAVVARMGEFDRILAWCNAQRLKAYDSGMPVPSFLIIVQMGEDLMPEIWVFQDQSTAPEDGAAAFFSVSAFCNRFLSFCCEPLSLATKVFPCPQTHSAQTMRRFFVLSKARNRRFMW
jgi:hypothetical protein